MYSLFQHPRFVENLENEIEHDLAVTDWNDY